MLQMTKGLRSSDDPAGGSGASFHETVTMLVGLMRRQLTVFLILTACTTIVGLLYLFTTPSSYTAVSSMVIDTRKVQLFQQQSVLGDIAVDAGTVQTQIEILKSQNIGLAVVKELHLNEDPEFTGAAKGITGAVFGSLLHFVGSDESPSEAALQRRALAVYESHRTIMRVPNTYVMEISYRSLDPDKAARIANAIADAYVADQLEAKYQATRRASVWLQERIKELRTQASVAEKAVLDFKQENNIVDAGGRLMGEQQLAEVSSQLIMAHAAVAEAKARLDNINEVMKQAIPDGSVTDALKSEIIIKLRNQYLELASREALWTSKYGATHLAIVAVRNQMDEIKRNISDEMGKIAASYKNDYDIALARETSIKSSLDHAVSESRVTDKAQIQLRELESNAQTYRAMYDNFLQRYMEAVQQQSFPITEARVISAATRPLGRSAPNSLAIIAGSLSCGIMLGFGVALAREMADRVFRTTAQVDDRLHVSCLAIVPRVQIPGETPIGPASLSSHISALFHPVALGKISSHLQAASEQPPIQVSPAASQSARSENWLRRPPIASDSREIAKPSGILRYVMDEPFSQFTEALRGIKVAIDLSGAVQANKIIGLTSSLPNEGKSTIATNLAMLIAHAGAKTILVDADLRNPSLSRHLTPGAEFGLVDVLAGRLPLEAALWPDPDSGLVFLPVGNAAKLAHTHEILGSERAKNLFGELRDKYEYIIADFAPLAPVVDTRTTTNFVDSYIYAIEWGKTKIEVAEQSLIGAPEVYNRLLGIVLNKADMSALGRYEHHRSSHYYKKYYARYGYTA